MSRRSPARVLAAAAVALLVTGCGTSPVSPSRPASTSLPVLVVAADGSSAFVQANSLLDSDGPGESRALHVSKEVDGSKGGWLQCGRFLLTVPAGAFDSVATVTMSMRDSTAMLVDLEIAPASRNKFAVPVVLACNTTGSGVAADSVALYWYDPASGTWLGMASDKSLSWATDCVQLLIESGESGPDLTNETDGVATRLDHFSKYSTGKAGW